MGAQVIVTLQINAASPEADLHAITEFAKKEITASGGRADKIETQELSYGLKAIVIKLVVDEEKGGTEELEKKLATHPEVASVQVTQVSRAFG